jgi:DNA-binding LytR/AlgR family response regulator
MRATALIAEDETPQREELRDSLAALWPELTIVAECSDGLAALEAEQSLRPQIAFLDIRMPGVDGLEVARAIAARTHVIFTTAYDRYAIDAFDRGAFDYLLKPIGRERLAETLRRVRERLHLQSSAEMVERLDALRLSPAADLKSIKWITANAGNTIRMFAIDDVLYFQAQDKYTRVVAAREEAVIRTPLKDLLIGLDSQTFWQVHRSVIVRVSAIEKAFHNEDGKLELSIKGRQERLPVSSAFHYRFKPM